MEGEHGPTVTEVPSGAVGRLIHFLRSYLTLPRTHSIIGIVAGCLSISLGLYSYLHLAKPAAPVVGDLVAVVQDARTGKPVNDATVEILTLKDAVVTTLVPGTGRPGAGQAEGRNLSPARHPSAIHRRDASGAGDGGSDLRGAPAARPARAPKAGPVDEAVGAVKKIFK